MEHYVALVHGEPGRYGISFPDFPGCVTAGTTVDAIVRLGIDALHFHMEGMMEDGDPLPAPSSVEAIRADPEFVDDLKDAVVTLVPVVNPSETSLHLGRSSS